MAMINYFVATILEYFFDGDKFVAADQTSLIDDAERSVADHFGVRVRDLLRLVVALALRGRHRRYFGRLFGGWRRRALLLVDACARVAHLSSLYINNLFRKIVRSLSLSLRHSANANQRAESQQNFYKKRESYTAFLITRRLGEIKNKQRSLSFSIEFVFFFLFSCRKNLLSLHSKITKKNCRSSRKYKKI